MNHWKRFLREGEVDTITWHRVCVGGGGVPLSHSVHP